MVDEIITHWVANRAVDRAVAEAQSSDAVDTLLEVLERVCAPLGLRDQHQAVINLLGPVPVDILIRRRSLVYWYGLALLSQARFAEGREMIAAYQREHVSEGDTLGYGRLLVMQALEQIFLGDSAAALEKSRAAMAILPSDALQERFRAWATRDVLAAHFGRIHDSELAFTEMLRLRELLPPDQHWWFVFVVPNRADHLVKTGRLVAAKSLLEAQLSVSPSEESQILRVRLASIALEQGDTEAAMRWLGSIGGSDAPLVNSYWSLEAALVRSQLDRQRGRPADAIDKLYQIIKDRHLYGSPVEVMRPNVVLADIWIEQDQVELASHWLHMYPQDLDSWPRTYGHPIPRLVLANLAMKQERWDDALGFLESLVQDGTRRGHGGLLIAIFAHIAVIHARLGDDAGAMAVVAEAVACDRNNAFHESYIVSGMDVRAFLDAAVPSVLNATPQVIASVPVLGVRELEVLSLARNGLRNQEIADRLYISLSTVKNHMANIFHRLGVASRADAFRKAAESGLLDPDGD